MKPPSHIGFFNWPRTYWENCHNMTEGSWKEEVTCLRQSFCSTTRTVLITANFREHLLCTGIELSTVHALSCLIFITTFWNATFIISFKYKETEVKRGAQFVQIPTTWKNQGVLWYYTMMDARTLCTKIVVSLRPVGYRYFWKGKD